MIRNVIVNLTGRDSCIVVAFFTTVNRFELAQVKPFRVVNGTQIFNEAHICLLNTLCEIKVIKPPL